MVGPLLMTMEYVMYFLFYGPLHFHIMGHMAHGIGNNKMGTTEESSQNFHCISCIVVVYNGSQCCTETKCDIYDCLVSEELKAINHGSITQHLLKY